MDYQPGLDKQSRIIFSICAVIGLIILAFVCVGLYALVTAALAGAV